MERFSSFDGMPIAYEVSGGEKGASAVILHHGFASTAAINWARPGLVDALVEAGRRVVTLDARGHGSSACPHEPSAYSGGAMASDVRALADHLGFDSFDMAGYSMGAYVALELAPGESRVSSLFLGGVGLERMRTDRPEVRAAIVEALEADDPSTVADASARAFRSFADATRQDRLALAAVERARGGPDLEAIRTIAVPAVVVNGDRDTLAGDPAEVAAFLPKGRSLVVPGDHLSAVVQPEFRAAIVEWATS